MDYLLDTHVLLWLRQNDPRLNRAKWEPVFYAKENKIFFSLISIWEIAIKRSLGKLKLEGVTMKVLAATVGVPEIRPVAGLMVRPAGSPVALYEVGELSAVI